MLMRTNFFYFIGYGSTYVGTTENYIGLNTMFCQRLSDLMTYTFGSTSIEES